MPNRLLTAIHESQARKWALGLCAALVLAVAHSAAATPILLGSTTNATGIGGLVVDGVTYDVTFISDTYNNVYGSSTPIFQNNMSLATDAMTALDAALNALQVTVLTGNSPGGQSAVIADGPVVNGQFLAEQSVLNILGPTWASLPESEVGADQTYGHNDIAVFVPEPATLTLFGSGLIAIRLLRRKRGSRPRPS